MFSVKHCIKIIGLSVVILICSSAYAQNNYYFYSYEVQKPLLLSLNKVTVKFLPTFTPDDIDNFILSEPAFDPNTPPESTLDDFLVLYVLPGNDIEELIQGLRTRYEVEMANPVYLTPDSTELIVTDQFVAQFYPYISRSTIDNLNAQHGVIIVDSLREIPNVFLLKLTGNIDKDALVTANNYNEELSTYYSHPDFVAEIKLDSYIPNDSFFQYQWNYDNTGQIGGKIDADIDAPLAWELCKGDSNLKVAVLDQGVEAHEDIGTLSPGYDVIGADLRDPQEDWDPTPGPDCPHGEACAGLIAATQNNLKGISGLATLCKIVPIKIFADYYCDYGTGDTWRIARAFDMASAYGAKVASNSWSYGGICDPNYYPDIVEAINFFIRPKPSNPEGGVVIFSSGNGSQSCVNFPANLDSVIAVGASDSLDKVWAYSNGGTALDLVAPSGYPYLSGDIWTMDLMGARGYNPQYPGPANVNYTARFGGTSGACPQVAATVALIKSQWWHLYQGSPLYSYQVKEIIEKSAEDSCYLFQGGGPDTTECFSLRYGYGRLNAFRALLAISRGDVNNGNNVQKMLLKWQLNCLMVLFYECNY
jgi:subtilisin family serine protease